MHHNSEAVLFSQPRGIHVKHNQEHEHRNRVIAFFIMLSIAGVAILSTVSSAVLLMITNLFFKLRFWHLFTASFVAISGLFYKKLNDLPE